MQKENMQQKINPTLRRERGHPCSLTRRRRVNKVLHVFKIGFRHTFSLLLQAMRTRMSALSDLAPSFLSCLLLCVLSVFFVSCSVNEPTPVQNTNANSQSTNPPVAVSHGSPAQTNSSSPPNKGGMTGTPIDTSKFDADIKKAEEKYNKNKNDNAAKMTLAQAYLDRGDALTEAAQYRSALGDYRRVLKLDPDNEDAKRMSGEIIRIFQSLKREPPKEGEEPPPLPYNK